jgi:hypothetical protein
MPPTAPRTPPGQTPPTHTSPSAPRHSEAGRTAAQPPGAGRGSVAEGRPLRLRPVPVGFRPKSEAGSTDVATNDLKARSRAAATPSRPPREAAVGGCSLAVTRRAANGSERGGGLDWRRPPSRRLGPWEKLRRLRPGSAATSRVYASSLHPGPPPGRTLPRQTFAPGSTAKSRKFTPETTARTRRDAAQPRRHVGSCGAAGS